MNKSGNCVSNIMDWQLNHSLSECTSHLYMNEHMSDVTIVLTSVHPPRRVPVHRFLLAIRSPVFEAMFYGALQEVEMEVTLSDVPVEGFLTFLRFLYTDVAEIQTDNAMECLQVGHMYRVPGFVAKCESFLMSHVTASDVLALLETSIIFNLQMLKTQCMENININALSVIKSEAFVFLSRDALKMIVGESGLQAPELEIYKAVNRWADKACERGGVQRSHQTKRTFLGDAFSKLRIGHITQSDFASVVATENLLSKDEMLMVFRFHNDKTVSKLNFVENAQRAGTIACSVPAQLTPSNRPRQMEFLKTSFKFNCGVNFVGIHINKTDPGFLETSEFDKIFSLLLVEENSLEQKQSTKTYGNSAMHPLKIHTVGKSAHPTQRISDVLFDTTILLKPEKSYTLCIAIMYFAAGELDNTDLKSWKIFNDNELQQTADGQKYKRHSCRGKMSFRQEGSEQCTMRSRGRGGGWSEQIDGQEYNGQRCMERNSFVRERSKQCQMQSSYGRGGRLEQRQMSLQRISVPMTEYIPQRMQALEAQHGIQDTSTAVIQSLLTI